jgi:V-type H+-transporting ATPase subunit F
VADAIRETVDDYDQAFPTVLEIPSKDHPYDASKVHFYWLILN